MVNKDVEFRVGVIILIGIILLAVSIFWLRDYQLEKNSKIVQVRFDDVGTLAEGDKITVYGVRMGKVKKLELDGSGVVVDLLIDQEVQITKGTKFVIKNFGVMGERFIAITQGEDMTPVEENSILQGDYDTGLPEVMGLMGDMMVELRELVHSFKQTVGSDSSLTKFNATVSNLESVSANLDNYLKRNQTKLDNAATNFYKASNSMKDMVSNNSEKVDSTAARMDRMTVQLETFVGKLDTLATSFRTFADNLNNPEGTLQLLTEDRRLYDDLRKTADNLDDLILDVKANPQKYINLKVELF